MLSAILLLFKPGKDAFGATGHESHPVTGAPLVGETLLLARAPMTTPYRPIWIDPCTDRLFKRGPRHTRVAWNDASRWPVPRVAAALLLIAGAVHPDAFAQSAPSAPGAEAGPAAETTSNAYFPLLVAQSLWLALVGVGAPLLSGWRAQALAKASCAA